MRYDKKFCKKFEETFNDKKTNLYYENIVGF